MGLSLISFLALNSQVSYEKTSALTSQPPMQHISPKATSLGLPELHVFISWSMPTQCVDMSGWQSVPFLSIEAIQFKPFIKVIPGSGFPTHIRFHI